MNDYCVTKLLLTTLITQHQLVFDLTDSDYEKELQKNTIKIYCDALMQLEKDCKNNCV